MNKLLVINSGSSTIKVDVFVVEAGAPLRIGKALVDKIGKTDALLQIKATDKPVVNLPVGSLSVTQVLDQMLFELANRGLCRLDELLAVGHRVVHGGDEYSSSVIIDDNVIRTIGKMAVFAPLHNPANLEGITHCRSATTAPQVAVFDTAFHRTMPVVASTYAIDRQLSEKHGIRRYGFHGTSHAYVTRECARRMGIDYESFNAISLHLGNGASVCAVRKGRSIDTSMGFTPLEGLVMGTRSGDIDPSVPLFLQQTAGMTASEVESLLNKKSGLLGISGVSDMRELLSRSDAGNEYASLALDMFCTRAKKYLGAYLTWGIPHAIIFTGGIGENSPEIRERITAGLGHLGISISADKNLLPSPDGLISAENSTAIFVVETDEELMIARETLRLIV